MKRATRTRWNTGTLTREEVVTTTMRYCWERRPGGWQLPCGCIGPDIWTSADRQQGECTDCGRRWWHMGARGGMCVMLDDKPQGPPVVVLTKKMEVNDACDPA